jgi:DMSO reductase anchor subunit
MTAPPVLIPATPQRLWGPPAVANFVLGGLGAGFYLAAALAGRGPALAAAAWAGPGLVVAGLAAVATEAGRPLRGARVLARVRTSWMSRELLLAGVFVLLAVAERFAPGPALRGPAAATALAFALAQGLLVRRARAVIAWDSAAMPVLFVFSAMLSGGGLLVLVETLAGRGPGRPLLGLGLVALALGAAAWLAYLWSSDDPAFVEAVRPLGRGRAAVAIVAAAYVGPVVLLVAALALDWAAAAAAAGALTIIGHAAAKWRLILDAGALRSITLATLTLHGRPS